MHTKTTKEKAKRRDGNKAAEGGELWDVARCAKYLGKSEWWLYVKVGQKGGPPAVRVGRAIKFRPADIEKWLDDNTVTVNSTVTSNKESD